MDRSDVAIWFAPLVAYVGVACVGTTAPAPPPATAATAEASSAAAASTAMPDCGKPEAFGPVIVPRDQYDARTGAGARTFAALLTSKERPLEECGLRTVVRRLATLRCNDDSNPFDGNLRAAHESRIGNMGPGGRCGAIIDQYAIKCPEATYRVFADMYFCSEAAAKNFMGKRLPDHQRSPTLGSFVAQGQAGTGRARH